MTVFDVKYYVAYQFICFGFQASLADQNRCPGHCITKNAIMVAN